MAGRPTPERSTFYFDLGSPYAYLAAERVSELFSEAGLDQPEWQPILLGGLFKRFGTASLHPTVGEAVRAYLTANPVTWGDWQDEEEGTQGGGTAA